MKRSHIDLPDVKSLYFARCTASETGGDRDLRDLLPEMLKLVLPCYVHFDYVIYLQTGYTQHIW